MNHDTLTRRGLFRQAAGAAALVSALHAQNQPAAFVARIRESFDFGWKFFKGDSPGAQQPDFSDSAWRAVDLPHDWSIEGPFSEQEKAQGSLPTGIGWYRKRFRMPESSRDRMVVIEFDGVYQNSEVRINGQYLGKRPGWESCLEWGAACGRILLPDSATAGLELCTPPRASPRNHLAERRPTPTQARARLDRLELGGLPRISADAACSRL